MSLKCRVKEYVDSIKTMIKLSELKNIRCDYDQYHNMYFISMQERRGIWSAVCWFFDSSFNTIEISISEDIIEERETLSLSDVDDLNRKFENTIWPAIFYKLDKIENR